MRPAIFLAVVFCCGLAHGDIIYLSQQRTLTASATIVQAVPVVKSEMASATDYGPFTAQLSEDLTGGIGSKAQASGFFEDQLQHPNQFLGMIFSVTLGGSASGDSSNLYGLSAGSASAMIQFMSTTVDPFSLNAELRAGFATSTTGGDAVASSFTLTGGGQMYSASVPVGQGEITYNRAITLQPGVLYTLNLSASFFTDGQSPPRQTFTSSNGGAEVFLSLLGPSVPEPPTITLFASGVAILVAIALRRA